MKLYASWTHGNALTVESPENLNRVGHNGWGADMSVKAGKSSWFHIPVPTPVIVGDVRSQFQKFFLLFSADGGQIREVHIYDGSSKIQEFNGLNLAGEHRLSLDGANTFNLSTPHVVRWGIGITFAFTASIGFDSQIPPSRLIVASAGADFMA
ncbi:hypothetical protein H2198_001736 [Neophaeococcomyces mojaviensis]|uniref:Uncharacterized protein n=1 Tax=Neophaeococcomyces mojaviensis TaxID=3383035 RepID=A0ACC3AGK9_9EURO|nr:hypothetical protein H2198_001736 [Knufia sp. JES_112]